MDPLRNCHSLVYVVVFLISCIVIVSGLECYSCNSLGVGSKDSNDACVTLDPSRIGTEPCQAGPGQVAKCMTFKGDVTVDLPLLDPQRASGTYRSCATYPENAVPRNGCYGATDIPNEALSTAFKITNFIGAQQSVVGESCYCDGNRCNNTSGAVTIAMSYLNVMLLLALSIFFVKLM